MSNNKEETPQPNQENYDNISNERLPNVQQRPTNYPKETNADLQNNVCRYPSETAVSDKYFQKKVMKNLLKINPFLKIQNNLLL